jgi:hypothetical protein
MPLPNLSRTEKVTELPHLLLLVTRIMLDREPDNVLAQVISPESDFTGLHLCDPFMVQSLLGSITFVAVHLKHMGDEVLGLVRDGVPHFTSHLVLPLLDLDDEIVQPLRVKRKLSR